MDTTYALNFNINRSLYIFGKLIKNFAPMICIIFIFEWRCVKCKKETYKNFFFFIRVGCIHSYIRRRNYLHLLQMFHTKPLKIGFDRGGTIKIKIIETGVF